MKNAYFKLMMLISVLAGASGAQAGTDPRAALDGARLIEIQAEYYPNETFFLGYVENPDHTVNSIYYENNEHEKRFFSLKDLSKDVPIIQTTSGGTTYDLVRLKILPGVAKNTFDVTMSYMKNGLFKNRKKVQFIVEYNSRRQVYELKDAHSAQVINRTYVTTNYWGAIAVGIDNIQSSK